jgi:tetratricopeptide (TPR) repeat protein
MDEMMSETKVTGLSIIQSIKKDRRFAWLFCFWGIAGVLVLGVLVLKERSPIFAAAQKDVDNRYAIKLLNFHRPDSYVDLVNAIEGKAPIDKNYLTYFQLAAQYMPNDFASHYLLAISLHAKGDSAEAVKSYQRSIEANPYFFWSYYNLGVLLWNQGQKDQARKLWSMATRLPPELTIKSLSSTKLLTDCIQSAYSPSQHDPILSLEAGYRQALQWQQTTAAKELTPSLF